jgi:hypothetical protein
MTPQMPTLAIQSKVVVALLLQVLISDFLHFLHGTRQRLEKLMMFSHRRHEQLQDAMIGKRQLLQVLVFLL